MKSKSCVIQGVSWSAAFETALESSSPFTCGTSNSVGSIRWKSFFASWPSPGTGLAWFSGSFRFAASSNSLWVFNFWVGIQFMGWKPLHMVNLACSKPCQKKILFQQIEPIPLLVLHIKELLDSSAYVRKKGCLKCLTILEGQTFVWYFCQMWLNFSSIWLILPLKYPSF